MEKIFFGFLVALLFVSIDPVKSTCVLESDFGFTLNCAFKKSGLFRVRNLGGFKAHVGLGFSVGDELGFGQSLTNLDTSRRRSVNVKNGAPPNTIGVLNEQPQRQEKRGKQNRLTVRMPSPSPSAAMQPAPNPANMAAMQAILANTVKRRGTPAAPHMQPIIVQGESSEYLQSGRARQSQITLAKPFPLGVPPFKPLPPKDQSDVRVLPISNPTKQMYIAYPVADSKGPALPYTKPNSQATHDHVSKLLAQMTSLQNRQQQLTQRQDHLEKFTPAPVRIDNISQNLMTAHNNHVNLPAFQALPSSVSKITESPISSGLSVVPGPVFKNTVQIPTAPSMMSKGPTIASLTGNTVSLRKSQPAVPSAYPTAPSYSGQKNSQDAVMATNVYPIYAQSPVQKIDDVNSITGYGDEDEFKYSHEDEVAQKITAISKATNISVEAVEAAILLRQQQLLNRYAAISPSAASTTSSTTTSTTPRPTLAPEIIIEPVTPKRYVVANTAKVMNAPREYYPIGYEKNFDDQFTSRVELPETSFYCGDQKFFPGLYADENLGCMVFHVCALTDDGLVMKSFLCPESTLFDQTILKCNWWFYVDCKNSKSLYDTNIPISKSYQLMKALTFFSNYKKETQQAEQAPAPANMDGIKEAIAILENHKSETQTAETGIDETKPSGISVITPPRNGSIQNHRLNREFKERPLRNNSGEESAVHSAINQAAIDTLKVTPKPAEVTVDNNKVDRRRRLGQFSRKNKNNTINKYSTLDSTTSVLAESVSTTSAPEIQPITPAEEVKESSTHHRIARASEEDIPDLVAAESHTDILYVASPDKSILGEKPRIGKEATIARLDEAIIGKPESENRKKVNVIEIITPQSASS